MALISKTSVEEAAKRRRTDEVPIPSLGGEARLQALSAGELIQFKKDAAKHEKEGGDPAEMAAVLVSRCWIDGDGKPICPGARGVETLHGLEMEQLNELVAACMKFNGMAETAVEDAVKN